MNPEFLYARKSFLCPAELVRHFGLRLELEIPSRRQADQSVQHTGTCATPLSEIELAVGYRYSVGAARPCGTQLVSLS